MNDDDSRGLESPARSDASPRPTARVRVDGGTADDTIRDCLASIDYLTRTLHAAIRDGETGREAVDPETRREAARHVRGIRAEVSQVGLLLVGPEAVIPYRPGDDPDRGSSLTDGSRSFTTSSLGPDREALERQHEDDGSGCDDE